ncbi:MAG TPA: hypothetical protein VGR07_22690 [Thermoanaerobaculia bacterium]|jgi:hypothetical protein|nr:hypothetical protein [Thermoanaerobaculia bacterium]
MRPRLGCLLALVLLLALAGHIWFWYLPRLRSAVPDPEDLPGRLLASGAYDSCFWIPYPHQNLAAFAKNLPDPAAFAGAAARLADVEAPELPGFGPFAVPPADEVTACSERGGQGFRVAARVYPVLSWIAKAAGRLAGNPWLAGGTVEQERRTVRVAWEGNLWTVESGAPRTLAEVRPALSPIAPSAPVAPALAAVALQTPVSVFPAGIYRLRQSAGGAILALDGSPEVASDLPEPRPILLAASAPGDKTPAALALFDNVVAGSLQLPGAAAFYPPGGRQRWSLPAQSLMDLVTGRLPRGNAAGWAIVALDTASLEQAAALAPGLAHLVSPEAAAGSSPALRLGLWIDPPRALAIVSRLEKALEAVPFLDPQQVRRWRDAETVLTPLARCGRAALAAAGPPDAFTLRLSGCAGPTGHN